MKKIACLGSEAFTLGFGLAGIRIFYRPEDNLLDTIEKIKKEKEIGIVIVEQELLEKLESHDRISIEDMVAGTIIIFGIPKKEVPIDFGKYFINKELTLKSVFGRRIWETWEQTSELLKSGKVDLSKIITHKFALKDFEKAMTVMKSGKSGKIVLIP